VLWIALPACGSALLLAITNYLCQDVASLPLLWVAPLAIYLITFIVAFDADRWYVRWAWMAGFAAFAFASALTWIWDTIIPLEWQVVAVAGLLLTACMVCHGEAARLRPESSRLTSFYLSLSLGGVLGGLFVAIVAPLAFNDFYELPATAFATWGLAMVVLAADPQSPFYRGRRLSAWGAMAVAWSALTLLMAAPYVRPSSATLAKERNFFGVLKVGQRPTKSGQLRTLVNGRINHGAQFEALNRRREPTTYYSRDSGIGMLLEGPAGTPRRVGVVGLGTGTIATFAEPLDVFRFYDINPLAVGIAEEYFTYLDDARRRGATIETALGDARLTLEQEADQQFDVLALDAFSGDAIPVHLLTREAFEIYLRHLRKPSGVLAVHISNRHLDLQPVVLAAAEEYGLDAFVVEGATNNTNAALTSTWALLYQPGRSRRSRPAGQPLSASDGVQPIEWTDDYSSIVKILKMEDH
jgi:spermidine synthase